MVATSIRRRSPPGAGRESSFRLRPFVARFRENSRCRDGNRFYTTDYSTSPGHEACPPGTFRNTSVLHAVGKDRGYKTPTTNRWLSTFL